MILGCGNLIEPRRRVKEIFGEMGAAGRGPSGQLMRILARVDGTAIRLRRDCQACPARAPSLRLEARARDPGGLRHGGPATAGRPRLGGLGHAGGAT